MNYMELTPFKVHAAPQHINVAHGKRKLAHNFNIKKVNNEVPKRLATILNVQQSELRVQTIQLRLTQSKI